MAVCIRYHTDDKELLGVLQLEFDDSKNIEILDEEASSPKKASIASNVYHNPHHGKHPHFVPSDEQTFLLMSTFLALRMERFVFQRDIRNKMADRNHAIAFLSVICKQKTYKAMFRALQIELKKFFRFEDCAILFYSATKKQLFTLSGQDRDEDYYDQGFLSEVYKQAEFMDENYIDRMMDHLSAQLAKLKRSAIFDFVIKPQELSWFPTTLGLTSKTFEYREVALENLVAKKSECPVTQITEGYKKRNKLRMSHLEFNKDIDNSIGAKRIDNYLIGAMIGEGDHSNGMI